MNVANNLQNAAFYFPDRCAVIEDGREISYAQFNQESSRIASALVGTGVQPGDHAALCAPNSFDWLALYFGVLKAGAVAVTFSHLLSKAELRQIIADCRPKVLFTTNEKLAAIEDRNDTMVVCENGDISCDRLAEKGSSDFTPIDRDRQETCAILYTGGTTGTPKGAMLSHENLQTSIFNVAFYERSTQEDLALCFLPLNHVFAQIHIMHSLVFSGGGLVIQPAFDMEKVLDAVGRFRVTKFYAVPTVYIRLLLNNPHETRDAFWGDWFRSGDIGIIDQDGYLYIVDRLKDMIITGGENVYPREVEELLYAREEVQECAVVGLPDREYGERVTAFIVAQEGRVPDAATLKAFLKGRLAGFKVPKEFLVVDQLPKNNAGKLLKRDIKKKYASLS